MREGWCHQGNWDAIDSPHGRRADSDLVASITGQLVGVGCLVCPKPKVICGSRLFPSGFNSV